MKMAFLFNIDYTGALNVVSFSYQKKTAAMYLGCTKIRMEFGHWAHVNRRVVIASGAFDTEAEALKAGMSAMRHQIERAKVALNDRRSRLGEAETYARSLGVDTE